MRNLIAQNLKWVCHHAHLDKSLLITPELLEKAKTHMQEKWYLMRELKVTYTSKDLQNRMNKSVEKIVSQGCKNIRSFIDIDDIVGLTCIEEACKLRDNWNKKGVEIQLATQPLEGLMENGCSIELFEKAAQMCDIVGGLPSRDGERSDEHLDIIFSTAKRLGKPVEAHLDQLNIPSEKETEQFCDFVEKYNYQGMARSVHSVSLACKEVEEQKEIAKRLKSLDVGVIICPSAAISMTQHSEFSAPIHNSIAPLKILDDAGVNVGLGIDNIEDLFMPFCDGNMEFELRLLAEATRVYDVDILKKVAQNKMGFKN
jgi:cytosine/adenosine deaminase-related metal-dependent hydrolase